MKVGSKVVVVNGLWTGKRGIIKDLTFDGDLVVMLLDDQGSLGQWIMLPHELELDNAE